MTYWGLHHAANSRFRLWASYFLCFAKESNQRNATPHRPPSGSRDGTRGRALHQLALAGRTKRGPLRSSDRVPLFFPPTRSVSAALKGNAPVRVRFPLLCRGEAQPAGEKRGWVSELRSTGRFVPRARASSSPAPAGEHRREAAGRHGGGGLLFGYFFLATQEKVTRLQAKNKAAILP